MVVTEMVSSDGLVRGGARTRDYLDFDPAERPIGIQLFGSEPRIMAEAARKIEKDARPDFIDMNFGCPVRKVVGRRAGSALLREPARLAAIARQVASAVDIPVTAKIRSGWEVGVENAVEIARILEDSGIAAVAVHARTRGEAFGGHAHWDIIRDVKAAVGIPVIGNGDVRSPIDAWNLLRLTGCDAVMVGRAALGSPWIFRGISHFLRHGVAAPPPTATDRLSMLMRHYRMLASSRGPGRALREMRKHFAWYTKGIPGSAKLRGRVMGIDRPPDFERVADEFLASLRARGEAEWATPFDPPTDPRLHFAGGEIDSGPPAASTTRRLPLARREPRNAPGAPAASLSAPTPVS
jgi:nifR3 family TIM-barrel protein